MERRNVLCTLEEHVKENLIRVSRYRLPATPAHWLQFSDGYYRQTSGIPQGSRVSSMLCSYFYGHMERSVLEGVKGGESVSAVPVLGESVDTCLQLLLRIIDDFLLISTSQDLVERFVTRMLSGGRGEMPIILLVSAENGSGIPEYGCVISPAKSLVNFDYRGGSAVPRTESAAGAWRRTPYLRSLTRRIVRLSLLRSDDRRHKSRPQD